MEFKVRLFLGDTRIDPSDYDKIYIHCTDVDRIVNEIYERNQRRPETLSALQALYGADVPAEPPVAQEDFSILEKLKRPLSREQKQPGRQRVRDSAR